MPNTDDLEERKFALERDKLRVERKKLWLMPLSFVTPVAIAAATIIFGFWSHHERAKADFDLKTAEIIMSSPTASGTRNRARALAALFPNRVSPNFADSFTPSDYGAPNIARQEKLLQLVVEHPERKEEIIAMWKRLFPRDSWADSLQ
ncbi:MAG TPA: hypothetical protein VK581_01700 [Chthoniobacterales bacterium]|nr:hypothetical protein [Chthoniobacterales bacterium]